MLSVRWDAKGIINFEVQALNETMSAKLLDLRGKVSSHKTCSSDLAPFIYTLFFIERNDFARQTFNDVETVKTNFQQYFDSKTEDFYWRVIHLLPYKWQEIIHTDGSCLNYWFLTYSVSRLSVFIKKQNFYNNTIYNERKRSLY